MAYLLGIVMLIIAIGVIVIMIAYLIARIIGIWIILIFSSLFCNGPTPRLQKGWIILQASIGPDSPRCLQGVR